MFKLLPFLLLLWATGAQAQGQPQCPTRPVGDSTNACASTAFVNGDGTPLGNFVPNLPVIGSSSGFLSQGTRSGTTTVFGTTTGTLTNGDCVSLNNGNLVDAGGACTIGGGGGTVSAGTAGQYGYYPSNGTVIAGLTPPTYDATLSGVNCNGSFDNLTAIPAAIAAGIAQGSPVIQLPAGNCIVSGTMTITASKYALQGQGQLATKITCSFVGNCISLNPVSQWVRLENLFFDSSSARTSGAYIDANDSEFVIIHNIQCAGGGAGTEQCILVRGPNSPPSFNTNIQKVIFTTPIGIQIGAQGATTDLPQDIYIGDIDSQTPTGSLMVGVGILIYSGSGVFIRHADIVLHTFGMQIIPGDGQAAYGIALDSVQTDSNGTGNLVIAPSGTGVAYDLQFSNFWSVGASAGPGISIDGTPTSLHNIQFSNCLITGNSQQGMIIGNAPDYLTFTGCHVNDNSTAGSALYDGVFISGATAHVQFIGGVYGVDKRGANLQAHGINLQGNPDYIAIQGIDSTGNVGSGVNIGGAVGTHLSIVNNF